MRGGGVSQCSIAQRWTLVRSAAFGLDPEDYVLLRPASKLVRVRVRVRDSAGRRLHSLGSTTSRHAAARGRREDLAVGVDAPVPFECFLSDCHPINSVPGKVASRPLGFLAATSCCNSCTA